MQSTPVGLSQLHGTLTQIFPLQSFPLSLLGVHEGILGNHLNKQFLWGQDQKRTVSWLSEDNGCHLCSFYLKSRADLPCGQ